MKRNICFFILSMVTIMLMANPVGREVARAKAAQFLSASKTARVKNVQMMEKRLQPVEGDFSHLHIFNNGEDGGFVVVSAEVVICIGNYPYEERLPRGSYTQRR